MVFASGYVVIGNEGLGSLNFIMTVRGKSHVASQLRYLPQEMYLHSRHIVGEGSNKESVRGNHHRSRQYIQNYDVIFKFPSSGARLYYLYSNLVRELCILPQASCHIPKIYIHLIEVKWASI